MSRLLGLHPNWDARVASDIAVWRIELQRRRQHEEDHRVLTRAGAARGVDSRGIVGAGLYRGERGAPLQEEDERGRDLRELS